MTTSFETQLAKYDTQDVAFALEHLAQGLEATWKAVKTVEISARYRSCTQIVVVGAGASQVPGLLLQAYAHHERKKSVQVCTGGSLPGFLSSKTCVVLVSYSGNTKEVLRAARQAREKKAKLLIVSGGGKLAAFARRHKIPAFVYEKDVFAPSPNAAAPMAFVGLLGLLKQARLLPVSEKEIRAFTTAVAEVQDSCALSVAKKHNPAKIVAHAFQDHIPLIVGAEHLSASAKVFAIQLREIAQQWGIGTSLCEAYHTFPDSLSDATNRLAIHPLFLVSPHYRTYTKSQLDTFASFAAQTGFPVVDYQVRGKRVLEEIGEVLAFGLFTAYYRAIKNGVDPAKAQQITAWKK